MNWKELYALVNENIKNAVSGLYKPAGDVTFAELPTLSQSVLGYTYTVTDAFTTDSRFTDYDTETQAGHSFPADTEVAVIVTGTTENPVYMFNVMGGIMDGYATKSDLTDYVQKEQGKGLSSNDYTNADKALVQDSPITVTATGAEITANTAQGKPQKITIYGKSEVVNNDIHSAGEGWATVDLGTLTWIKQNADNPFFYTTSAAVVNSITKPLTNDDIANAFCSTYKTVTRNQMINGTNDKILAINTSGTLQIRNTSYTDATAFKTAMSGVYLAYQLADPTQGNTIAVKTDNGTGIDGTMWTFETGTPLRGIPDTTVRDSAVCDGQTGTVTKNCAEVDLGTLNYSYNSELNAFYTTGITGIKPCENNVKTNAITANYNSTTISNLFLDSTLDKVLAVDPNSALFIRDFNYTDPATFKTAMSGVKLVYELATHTTETMTATEVQNFNELWTFTPSTHITNNAGAEMMASAYAGTENGKAVNELKQDVQSEINALKITQSDTLTLTVADWSSNAQTVTYAHDTAKRNVIDVDPASVEEWASCGVLSTSETASGITFTCKTVPENALSFKVTSMGVN